MSAGMAGTDRGDKAPARPRKRGKRPARRMPGRERESGAEQASVVTGSRNFAKAGALRRAMNGPAVRANASVRREPPPEDRRPGPRTPPGPRVNRSEQEKPPARSELGGRPPAVRRRTDRTGRRSRPRTPGGR